MTWIAHYNGKAYDMPVGYVEAGKSSRRVKLSDEVLFEIDELDFANRFGKNAVWVEGKGPFVLLAYCFQLSITRWQTLDDAIKSKGTIDKTGCCGVCMGIHLIGKSGPGNPFREAKQRHLGEFIKTHDLKSLGKAEHHLPVISAARLFSSR